MCYGWTRPRRWADTRQRETANAEDDAGGDGGSGEAYEAGLFPSSKTPWACTTMGLTTVSGAKAATEDVEGRVQCIANTGPTGPRRMGGGSRISRGEGAGSSLVSSYHNRVRAAKQPRAGVQSTGEGWYCGVEAGPLARRGARIKRLLTVQVNGTVATAQQHTSVQER